jgi:hypothetical protein
MSNVRTNTTFSANPAAVSRECSVDTTNDSDSGRPAPYSKRRLQRTLDKHERRKIPHHEAVAQAMARTG